MAQCSVVFVMPRPLRADGGIDGLKTALEALRQQQADVGKALNILNLLAICSSPMVQIELQPHTSQNHVSS